MSYTTTPLFSNDDIWIAIHLHTTGVSWYEVEINANDPSSHSYYINSGKTLEELIENVQKDREDLDQLERLLKRFSDKESRK